MYCNKCGFILPDNSIFCSKCGNQLNNTQNVITQNEILADSLPYEGMPVITPQRSQQEEYMYFLRRNQDWYLPVLSVKETFKPSGRSPRQDFILYNIYSTCIQVVMIPVLGLLLGGILELSNTAIEICSVIFYLPFTIFNITLGVRRSHDVSSSGIPYAILSTILVICNFSFGVLYFSRSSFGLVLNFIYFFTILYLTFVKSSIGQNKYGENPYGE